MYAGTRQPFSDADGRVTPLALDVTSAAQVQAAAGQVGSLHVLINNAGIALYDDLSDPAPLKQQLAVNLFGSYAVTRGFDIPKASPESVARAIFDGVENGEEDIFPDPMSQSIAEGWRAGVAKTLERQYAGMAAPSAAA